MDLETRNKIKRLENMVINIYKLIDVLEKRTIQNSYSISNTNEDLCKHSRNLEAHKEHII